MKLIGCTFLLLVILYGSYCKFTSSVHKSSSAWGYNYTLNNKKGYTVKLDSAGFGLEPIYNDTSSDLKKHYNSWTFSDNITSPGVSNNGSQPHSFTTTLLNGTSNFAPDYKSNGAVKKLPDGNEASAVSHNDISGAGKSNKDFHSEPITKTHTVSFTDSETGAPTVLEITAQRTNPSYKTPVSGESSIQSNEPPYYYNSQNTLSYGTPTSPLSYPYRPSYYSSMYAPPSSSMYGAPNGPYWQNSRMDWYWSPNDQTYVPSIGPVNGYRPQNGQMYVAPTDTMNGYRVQNSQMNVPSTGPTNTYRTQNSQMHEPLTGPTNVYGSQNSQMHEPSTGPTNVYGSQNSQMHQSSAGPSNTYRTQNSQMHDPSTGPTDVYGSQNSQMHQPSTGSTNVYRTQNGQMSESPTGSLDGYRGHRISSLDGSPENDQTYGYPTKSSHSTDRYY